MRKVTTSQLGTLPEGEAPMSRERALAVGSRILQFLIGAAFEYLLLHHGARAGAWFLVFVVGGGGAVVLAWAGVLVAREIRGLGRGSTGT